jgi:branched-chain amino acid transport system ATP-binding protein
MPTSAPALELDRVSVDYGHVRAVDGVSFRVAAGGTTALLGPNGAGKSTVLRAVGNQAHKVAGRVLVHGTDISRTPAYRIARRGVVHVPEGRQVVAPLTVHENLVVAARAVHRLPARQIPAAIAAVYDVFPALTRLRDRPAGLLSGGEQQMVALGRAIVARPRILLLDEPSMGLAPVMVDTIYAFLADSGGLLDETSVLLAEQNSIALEVADHVVVLARGTVRFDGPVSDLDRSEIARSYLGAPAAVAPAAGPADPSEQPLRPSPDDRTQIHR